MQTPDTADSCDKWPPPRHRVWYLVPQIFSFLFARFLCPSCARTICAPVSTACPLYGTASTQSINTCACTGHNLHLRVISVVIFCKHCSGSAAGRRVQSASAATSITAEHLAFRYSSHLTFRYPHHIRVVLSICNENNARERNGNMWRKISKRKTNWFCCETFYNTDNRITLTPEGGCWARDCRQQEEGEEPGRGPHPLHPRYWVPRLPRLRTVSASWPAYPDPAARVAGGHTGLNTAATTMPKLPNPYLLNRYLQTHTIICNWWWVCGMEIGDWRFNH